MLVRSTDGFIERRVLRRQALTQAITMPAVVGALTTQVTGMIASTNALTASQAQLTGTVDRLQHELHAGLQRVHERIDQSSQELREHMAEEDPLRIADRAVTENRLIKLEDDLRGYFTWARDQMQVGPPPPL